MSALLLKADIRQRKIVMSALCQKQTYAAQQIAPLFDQLVGARQQRLRDGDAERLCRLEIDHQFKFG